MWVHIFICPFFLEKNLFPSITSLRIVLSPLLHSSLSPEGRALMKTYCHTVYDWGLQRRSLSMLTPIYCNKNLSWWWINKGLFMNTLWNMSISIGILLLQCPFNRWYYVFPSINSHSSLKFLVTLTVPFMDEYHIMEWLLNTIKNWLFIPITFLPPWHQNIIQTGHYGRSQELKFSNA